MTFDRALVETVLPDEVPYPEAEPEPSAEAAPDIASILNSTPYGEIIAQASAAHGVDPLLVRAVIQVESNYKPRARSPKGAMGLMQLMPATAAVLAVSDPYDPDQNVRGGTAYLARLLDRYGGDLALALAAYNAGPEAVDRHGGVPPYAETREYVRRVLRLYDGREAILPASGRAPSPRLVRGEGDRLLLTNTAPY
jgi:soluble lytic murein transglycosylase-like protein